MEIGIYTFADITPDPSSDNQFSAHQRLKDRTRAHRTMK